MSLIVASSFDKRHLNNFFMLLNKDFSLFNNGLIKNLYYSLTLCKTKTFFLNLIIINQVELIRQFNFKIFLLFLLRILKCRGFHFFHYIRYSIFFNSQYNLVHSIFSSFLNIFLSFVMLFFVYVYVFFFFFYNKNKGFGLPTKKHYEVVLRSPHGHKKSKERFVKKLYRRGLQYPSFYVTDTHVLLLRIFHSKKGILISNKYSMNIY